MDDRFVYATTRTRVGEESPTHAEHETGDLVAIPVAGGPMESVFAVDNVDCSLVLDRGRLLTCDDSGLQTSGRLISIDLATREVKTARFARGRFCLAAAPVGDELLALMLDNALDYRKASLVALPAKAADDENIVADEEVLVLRGLNASTRPVALDGQVVVERLAQGTQGDDDRTELLERQTVCSRRLSADFRRIASSLLLRIPQYPSSSLLALLETQRKYSVRKPFVALAVSRSGAASPMKTLAAEGRRLGRRAWADGRGTTSRPKEHVQEGVRGRTTHGGRPRDGRRDRAHDRPVFQRVRARDRRSQHRVRGVRHR